MVSCRSQAKMSVEDIMPLEMGLIRSYKNRASRAPLARMAASPPSTGHACDVGSYRVTPVPAGLFRLSGVSADQIGKMAHRAGAPDNLHWLGKRCMMNPRVFRMIETHARIDDALRREQTRPAADWQRVRELKKLKLRIKDLIGRLVSRKMPKVARMARG